MAELETAPAHLNIISLNCWGLKYISKLHKERLSEIGRKIAVADPVPHIVGLQELWTQEDYQSIREHTKRILPYGKFYHGGVFGAGLAILSKWPIEQSSMMQYPLNGRPTAFWRGDWYVGKGVACARIRMGPLPKDVVEVFNTHLHAPYEKEPNDSYICHRTAQAWEISKLIRGAAERGHLVLALGDFNMLPLSLAHRLISTHAPVADVWRTIHPDSSLGASADQVERNRRRPIPTAEFNIRENGTTCDSAYNTWRWDKAMQKRLGPNQPEIEVHGDTVDPKAKRLDYIFAGTGSSPEKPGSWAVADVRVGMMDRHPDLQCSLSDHFAVEATLAWQAEQPDPRLESPDDVEAVKNGVYLQNPPTSEPPRSRLSMAQVYAGEEQYLAISVYDEILTMVQKYLKRERKQRRLRMYHFLGSLIVSIGCLIAVWWSPRKFVAFLLMLLSTLGLAAGVIDGLIGGLFMSSEIRALKEFEWEIRNVRAAAGGPEIAADTVKSWS